MTAPTATTTQPPTSPADQAGGNGRALIDRVNLLFSEAATEVEGDVFYAEPAPSDSPDDWPLSPAQEVAAIGAAGAPSQTGPPVKHIHELTDLGNSQRFAAQHRRDVRYVWPWGKWLVWDRTRWKVDDTGAIARRAKKTVRGIHCEAGNCEDDQQRKAIAAWARASERRERISAMIDLARSEPGIPILPDALDQDPWALNCPNGTLDLRTGKLRPHNRTDYITRLCPTAYDPAADCPRWKACLSRAFADNANLIGFLQRLLGYCATGSVRDHILPIWWGSGANGKSTILGAIMDVLGPDYTSKAPPELLMLRRGEHHPTERADLFGKRLVVAMESQEGGRLNEALIKDLTGGDRQKARRMREDFWEFEPSHKLILATNHKPTIKDTTHSTWRRVKLVPFEVTIPEQEQDATLPDKLRAERAGILVWTARGCLEWQRIGLSEPDAVKVATQEYRSQEDVIRIFLDDCCRLAPAERERASTLYAVYKRWAERGGEHPISQARFGKALTERGLGRERANGIWYVGIALQPTDFD